MSDGTTFVSGSLTGGVGAAARGLLQLPRAVARRRVLAGSPALAVPSEQASMRQSRMRSRGGRLSLETEGTSPQRAADLEARRGRRRVAQSARLVADLRGLGRDSDADKVNRCGNVLVEECGSCNGQAGRRVRSCDNRLCPYCAAQRGANLADSVCASVEGMANPVLLVLTVRNGPSLRERTDALWGGYEKLIRRKAFKAAFRGGHAFYEASRNVGTGEWHPHLHCILDGSMAQRALSDLWRSCTKGDSFIVHISQLRDRTGDGYEAAVKEACKYPCKVSSIVGNAGAVAEFLDVLKGRRLYRTFGDVYGISEAAKPLSEGEKVYQDTLAAMCPHCGAEGSMSSVHSASGWRVRWSVGSCVVLPGGWYVRAGPGGGKRGSA